MPDLWATRRECEVALVGSLNMEASVVDFGFRLIDRCASLLSFELTPFGWVCLGTLIKARNLALGCYSLVLDGLAQESGALLRPLLETSELLIYFSEDTKRVDQVIQEQKIPKAGEVAKAIGGQLKELREYLNNHASHFNFSDESLGHIFNAKSGGWRLVQPYDELVVRNKLGIICIFVLLLINSSCKCLLIADAMKPDLLELLRDWQILVAKTFPSVHMNIEIDHATITEK